MLIYEVEDSWSIHGYLDGKCWDGGTGLERLRESGIDHEFGKDLDGIELAKNGHTCSEPSKSIFIGWEPPLILPGIYNDNKKWHGKLYTSLRDGGLHITTPNPLQYDELVLQEKTKKCCMVISNKNKAGQDSIYNIRQKIVSVGKENGGFDLYGMGWGKSEVYRGEIPWDRSRQRELWRPKVQKMSEYKFAFVTENSRVPGYVTEKITNALVARCVPIYLGAPDIDRYVPEECFLDLEELGIEGAFKKMKEMSSDEYQERLGNIEDFVNSEKSYYLSSYYLADRILEALNTK